ncbi:MAG: NAD-binding protein [Gemmatimonadales bacterium]
MTNQLEKSGRRNGWVGKTLQRLWGDLEWPLVGVLFVAALVLGFVGFLKYFAAAGELRSRWDLLYLALQLFNLESGSLASGAIPWELQVARLLAPAVAVYTVIKTVAVIFGERFERFRARFYRSHVVICGLGRKGLLLARSLRARGDRVVVVELDAENDLIGTARGYGAVVLVGDLRDPQMLRRARVHKASHLVAVAGDDGVNAEVAVRARELATNRDGQPLSCLVHIVDPQLCTLLRMQEIGRPKDESFRLDFFNVFESGARTLLREYPVAGPSQSGERSAGGTVVVGLGHFGANLVLQAALDWRAASGESAGPLQVIVVDRHAKALTESLRLRNTWLERLCELTPQEMMFESAEFREARFLPDPGGPVNVSAVYVCQDDDTEGLSTALAVHGRVKGMKVPVVVRMTHSAGLAALLGETEEREGEFAGLHAFGLIDRICNADLLTAGAYEIIARAAHEEYVAEQVEKKKIPADDLALADWDVLPESLKESNRDQAAHVGMKLQAVGCELAPLSDWDEESFKFEVDELEKLAVMEHERWVKERLRNGWTRGPRNPAEKTTPYLVPWDELDEATQDNDRLFIRSLPRILARAGLRIVRVEGSQRDRG